MGQRSEARRATPKRTRPAEVWLWDGLTEYEGVLVKFGDRTFTARLRQVRKGPAAALGKPIPASTLDLGRLFADRRFLAHFEGTAEDSLFEARVGSVQRSSDGDYDYLLDGRFAALDPKELEALGRLPVEGAARLLRRKAQ